MSTLSTIEKLQRIRSCYGINNDNQINQNLNQIRKDKKDYLLDINENYFTTPSVAPENTYFRESPPNYFVPEEEVPKITSHQYISNNSQTKRPLALQYNNRIYHENPALMPRDLVVYDDRQEVIIEEEDDKIDDTTRLSLIKLLNNQPLDPNELNNIQNLIAVQ